MGNSVGRRQFLQGTAASALTFAAGRPDVQASASGSPARVVEPARAIPVVDKSDVVVCGGGPAGCAAAIAAGSGRPGGSAARA